MIDVAPGILLISDPFLKDPNFTRTVVFVCEHDNGGTLGFVLNKLFTNNIGELLPELEGYNIPLYIGGPVEENTVHFLHKCPLIIEGGIEIEKGIFWGGNFDAIIELIKTNELKTTDIKFFLGYSGWEKGQLQEELDTKSWITSPCLKKLVFNPLINNIWKDALKNLGGEYTQMINYPLDPQLN